MTAKIFMPLAVQCALQLTVFTHNSEVSHNAISETRYFKIFFINFTVVIWEKSDRQLAHIYDFFTANSSNISKHNLFRRPFVHHDEYESPCPCPLYFSVFTQTTFMQREIISRKRFMEAVRQFGSSTIRNRILINIKNKYIYIYI